MGSKMNRMVLLYMLILSMVSLPTSLARHLLVETAGNQGGDDYHRSPPRLPPSGGSDYEEPKPELNLGHFTLDQFKKGSETYNKIKELEKKGEDYCDGPFISSCGR